MRVVSLVPSATETLLALGVTPVACTRFCEQPGLRTVGGTKNPDVATIVELDPDLVVVNDEENRREDFDALRDAGVTVHSMSPRDVADVLPAVRALADAVGGVVPPDGATATLGGAARGCTRGRGRSPASGHVCVATALDDVVRDHIRVVAARPGRVRQRVRRGL